MAASAGNVPSPSEVRAQLHHMMRSKRFISAFMQAHLLRTVTERALDHEEIKEEIIARILYRNYLKDLSCNVRVLAHLLRRSLSKYYEAEGGHDPVLILLPTPEPESGHRLPNGKAYVPTFQYNHRRFPSYKTSAQTPDGPEPFVSAEEAAKFLSVSRGYILSLARRGFKGAYRLGTGTKRGTWIFRLSELANAVQQYNPSSSQSDSGRSRNMEEHEKGHSIHGY